MSEETYIEREQIKERPCIQEIKEAHDVQVPT